MDRCTCGADLRLLRELHALADAWFNEALAAAERGDMAAALRLIGACCTARPRDAQARYVMAQLFAQLGCLDEAEATLARCHQLDPGHPGVAELQRGLARTRQRQAGVWRRPHRAWAGMRYGRRAGRLT
ncbi:MAG: tetratricopeptide repeat protein [Armatimonadota bacterium]|nr:tetratricopeptide repeat protein [Armatimonadota bacterium]